MSLLLEALKRAEDKGRRRQAGAFPPDRLAAGAAPLPTLDLQQPGEPEELEVELTAAPPVDAPSPAEQWEPELALASAPAPLTSATARATPSAPASRSMPAPPPALAVPPAAGRPGTARASAPRPAAADARSAERLLAAQQRSAPGRGRQGWLLAAVALVGAGVAALWLWPEDPVPLRRPLTQGPVAGLPAIAPAPSPEPASAAPAVVAAAGVPGQPASSTAPPMPPSVPLPGATGPAAGIVTAAPAMPVAVPSAPPSGSESPRGPAVVAAAPPTTAELKPPVPRAEPVLRPARRAVPMQSAAGPTTAAASAPAAEPSPRQAAASQLQRQLQQAYVDFQAGRTQEATQAWRDVVRADPTQRDAWLGLAISAHRLGERDAALAAYRQVLRLDPENGEAVGAMVALEAAGSDVASESRLRDALARNPGNAMLNSALARQLSGQGRWDEAQPFWFAAHAAAPDQPTHAYNLAVALDRLRKVGLAAQYYRKALELQRGRAATFDASAARARLQALEAAAGAAPP